MLYDLEVDPGEHFDVASLHPDVVADLARAAQTHLATVTPAKSQLEDFDPNAVPKKYLPFISASSPGGAPSVRK